jgi:membrane-associated phospholipid phosphatase
MSTTTVWGAAAAMAWLHRKRATAVVLGVPIALTGVSSGVQGVHWPSDALAGTLLGALAAVAMLEILYPWGGRPKPAAPDRN